MDPLIVLKKASLRDYCLDTHWGLLMVKGLDLIKAPLERYLYGREYMMWSWGGCLVVLVAIQ